MSVQRISIDMPEAAASVSGRLGLQGDDKEGLARVANLISAIGGGVRRGKVRVNVGAVQAAGTVTFASFAAADTVTVNGVAFTGRDATPSTNEFLVGASNEACANNFRTCLNASASNKIVGCVKASRRATVQFSSFVADDTVTINGVVFTGKASPASKYQFQIGGDDSATAESFMLALQNCGDPLVGGLLSTSRSTDTVTINYNGSLTVASSAHTTNASDIVVVTAIPGGQLGNLFTLAISAHGSVSGAALTGGTEGTEYVIDGNNANAL